MMRVQLETRPAAHDTAMPTLDFDLDAVDHALDRGDLETVRCLLGVSQDAWRLMLANL
jgi:hypothetical protein